MNQGVAGAPSVGKRPAEDDAQTSKRTVVHSCKFTVKKKRPRLSGAIKPTKAKLEVPIQAGTQDIKVTFAVKLFCGDGTRAKIKRAQIYV